jgi:cytochrome c-type biogenesis protein CcmH
VNPRLAGRLLALALVLGAPLAGQAPAAAPPELTPIDPAQVESVVGAPQGERLTGEALEAEALRISSVLRCPVCQGLSVADSPSPMATHMRQQVRDLVAAGFVEDQVLSYFEASYGEFVRLEPPLRGVNWLVWLAPAGGLALGLGVVLWFLRGARAASPPGTPLAAEPPAAEPPAAADPDLLPADPALARAVLRVRETAYGWPGGRRPEAR